MVYKKPALTEPLRTYFDYNEEVLEVPSDVAALFVPLQLGDIGHLEHRIVYAPLTRCRSPGNIPQAAAIEYYTQHASRGGFLISEGTIVAPEGHGYPNVPGIWRDEEREAWKPIVAAVKAKGAIFAMQLWHVGRASHTSLQPGGNAPLGPSAIPVGPEYMFNDGTQEVPYSMPRAMTKEDINQTVEYFRKGACNAIDAGFDGVEIHGANGYLLNQFMCDGSNKRTDEYGGPIENRMRFPLEVIDAVVKEVGAGKVGLRLSPFTPFMSVSDTTPYATWAYLLEKLNGRNYKLAYVHMVESRVAGASDDREGLEQSLQPFHSIFNGRFLAAGGYKAESAAEAIASGHADAIAFGRWFLANPDFPKRILLKAPLNKYDRNTFYQGGPHGYTDYPLLSPAETEEAKLLIKLKTAGKETAGVVESLKGALGGIVKGLQGLGLAVGCDATCANKKACSKGPQGSFGAGGPAEGYADERHETVGEKELPVAAA